MSDDTDKIPVSGKCLYHIDHKNKIDRNIIDIKDIWKEINGMKKLIIGTLLSSCLSLIILVITIVKDVAIK